MSGMTEDPAGFLRNHGLEVRCVESELLRRMYLMGIGADNAAAVRQVFGRSLLEKGNSLHESMITDLLGLGLVLAKLVHQILPSASALWLEPATRALLDTMQGKPV